MKDKILEVLEKRDELQKEILELIGYKSNDNSRIEYSEDGWLVQNDELYFTEDDSIYENYDEFWENGDYYCYTISSYSSKGEELYMKRLNDITIIMAYPVDSSYYETTIFILDNTNEIKHEN